MVSPERTADPGLPKGALSGLRSRVGRIVRGDREGRGLRLAFCCSEFNGNITWRLLDGAISACDACRVDKADVAVVWVPGAFELPLAARGVARGGTVDAVVCLGAVIRGETGHYDFVAGQCAQGLQQVQLDTGCPMVFGVLTTDTYDQALARSRPTRENKGYEGAVTAVEMARLLQAPMMGPGGDGPPSSRGDRSLSRRAVS